MSDKSGEYTLLHIEQVQTWQRWMDEMCLREHGFRLSELRSIEKTLARLAGIPDRTPEAEAEFQRVRAEYREVWYPRRLKLEGP